MSRLDETVALVTGSTSGIGRGIVTALAAAGATVGINYPPFEGERERAEDVLRSIEENGGNGVLLEADVSSEDSVRSMVQEVEEAYGTPDVLVNNAGILTQSPLAEMSVEMWDETMHVDLRGVFLVTRFVLPGMLDRGSGKIINVASQLGIKGGEELVHYSAAKAGVIGMTRALAREVSPTVNVNAIAPGPIETPLMDDITAEWKTAKAAELPMKRFGTVEDVAPTAVFLASDESDYYTGQVLSPDGGDAMH
ncbi:SDR family NAD(P)-dependent oxidoreductase [Salinigranum halophilum]|uniref:SDR family NAD(P)-dependent oxidoreductase n=1 Tax=Salinigranum halophilum TaxID=2565931 RepID=UPI00115DD0B9|nr:3-oxoacyl-ACP reductase family protein [Salinigranum halophilum]